MKRYQQTVKTTNSGTITGEGGLSSLTYIFPFSPGYLRGVSSGLYVNKWDDNGIYYKPEIVEGATVSDYELRCTIEMNDKVKRSDYYVYRLYDLLKKPEDLPDAGSNILQYSSIVSEWQSEDIIYQVTNDNGVWTEHLKDGYIKGNIYMVGYYLFESSYTSGHTSFDDSFRIGFLSGGNYNNSTDLHYQNIEYINSLNIPGYGTIGVKPFVTDRNLNIWYGTGIKTDDETQQTINYYPRLNSNNNLLPTEMQYLNALDLDNYIKVQQFYYPGKQKKRIYLTKDITQDSYYFNYANGVILNDTKLNKYVLGNYADVDERALYLTQFYDENEQKYKKVWFCFVLIGGA